MTTLESEELLIGDDKIIAEAKRRFTACQDWEVDFRNLFLDDLRFANGDCDNGYQWPDNIRNNRNIDDKPCLTINKTRQHNLQIINDARQNKPSVRIRPMGGGASYESADVYEGVVRHIEYISNAQAAYDTATRFQVTGGIGYWRVVTDYVDEDSFDQEIFIRRIRDPLTVYLDPDITEADGSDARFGFIFDDLPKEDFNENYPEYKDQAGQSPLGNSGGWIEKDHVRIAEYYRRETKEDWLVALPDPATGERLITRLSEMPPELAQAALADERIPKRKLEEYEIQWFLIVGNKIVDRKIWPGKYIPIVRVVGEETIIDGQLDRKGHTRNLKDPQRIYNYWSSAAVEFVALQGKTPWVGPMKAFEGFETYWDSANRINHAWLPYNHVDDEANPIPPPSRQAPPTFAPAYIEGMQVSQREMMMVSGQYDAQFGAPSNETSGKAINERQRQGDNATYHFIDHLALAIRFTGKILIDLIPKVYDTPRIMQILAEDGTESQILLDPKAQAAYVAEQQVLYRKVSAIFNPNVGKYEVEADVGPAYATQRQEAWNAFTQIAAQNPALMGVIGDLMFKNADFPGADKIAERLERMVPEQAKGGPNPELLMLQEKAQQQLQHMQGLLAKALQDLAQERLKSKSEAAQKDIDAYKAITDRLDVLLKQYVVTPEDANVMMHDLMKEEHRLSLQPVERAAEPALEEELNG